MNYSEGSIAPVVIEALMHCHCRREPLPDTESMRVATNFLVSNGLIQGTDTDRAVRLYETTERGAAYVTMICSLPFPVEGRVWRNPVTKAVIGDRT